MSEPFDISLVQRGARLRRTPYFKATQRYGAKGYTVYNHMFFPINYDDLEVEYWKLLNDVTVWDVSVERQVEITGPDAFAFTNLLTPRDLGQCAVGQGKYVVITAEDGGVINDPVLLRLGENHFWLALADSDVLLWAKGVALNAGMDVTIVEPDVSPMQIQGPKSKEVVHTLFGDPVLELEYYFFLETELGGIPVVVTRTGWTGEVGYEIYLRDGRYGEELWERVMDAGRPYNITPTGPSDIRRVEAGILNYGADMTLENNPYEVGLGWLVDLDQEAEFIGKEALKRIKAEGVRRKLAGVEIGGRPLPFNMTKWPIYHNGEQVGFITSAIYSPRLKKNLGYANVPVELASLGSELTVFAEDVNEERPATVVRKPFVDPEKEIPKS
ncbi:MAG: glycine cleavage system protein T [Chloroflexi bacterium]|nr:glycine cleavage system protein T [Chloroflexota bacterium]MCI0580628.1 glycine cleavage system protein T [Chloroflexota bacterium]MCI0647640.1 glycine cleavage system protein T [Chloroflexota bacterium]MCI0731144.1 glycine cleavage system protein T [Chloroflexota bacterium]